MTQKQNIPINNTAISTSQSQPLQPENMVMKESSKQGDTDIKKTVVWYNKQSFREKVFYGSILCLLTTCIHSIPIFFRHLLKKKENEEKHKHKLIQIEKDGEIQKELLKEKADLKDRNDERKVERKKKFIEWNEERKEAKKGNSAEDLEEESDDEIRTFDDIQADPNLSSTPISLGPAYIFRNEKIGFFGPTNCGKTSFIRQLAVMIAKGKVIGGYDADWKCLEPIPVLYIDCENTEDKIKAKLPEIGSTPLLIPISGNMKAKVVIKKLDKRLKKYQDYKDILVVLDNDTKWYDVNKKNSSLLNDWFDSVRDKRLKEGKGITLLTVYHAGKHFDPYKDFGMSATRGNSKIYDLCQSFLYFGPMGGEKWCLREFKNKNREGGEKETVSVYVSAKDRNNFFKYSREISLEELLENKPTRGRPNSITDEILQEVRDKKLRGKALEEYAKSKGFTRQGIEKQLKLRVI